MSLRRHFTQMLLFHQKNFNIFRTRWVSLMIWRCLISKENLSSPIWQNLAAFYNTEADFCPMAQKTNQVYCEDKFQEADFPYDTYSEGSRCFNTDQTRSVCLNAFCNSTTRQIQGSLRDIDANFTCEYDGQKIFVDAVQLQFNFTCPPFKHFCPE